MNVVVILSFRTFHKEVNEFRVNMEWRIRMRSWQAQFNFIRIVPTSHYVKIEFINVLEAASMHMQIGSLHGIKYRSH
jgi:hypothetical protein